RIAPFPSTAIPMGVAKVPPADTLVAAPVAAVRRNTAGPDPASVAVITMVPEVRDFDANRGSFPWTDESCPQPALLADLTAARGRCYRRGPDGAAGSDARTTGRPFGRMKVTSASGSPSMRQPPSWTRRWCKGQSHK